MRSWPVPGAAGRLVAALKARTGRTSALHDVIEPMLAARDAVLGAGAAGPPRLLVRVDEFPHYRAWDDPGPCGTDAYRRFHAVLRDAGIPYLVAVVPRVPRDPLNPGESAWRPHDDSERDELRALAADGVTFATHGLDHRTRDAHPRRHSELSGLDAVALAALLDAARSTLARRRHRPAGVRRSLQPLRRRTVRGARRALRRRDRRTREHPQDGLSRHAAVARRRGVPARLSPVLRNRRGNARRARRTCIDPRRGAVDPRRPALGMGGARRFRGPPALGGARRRRGARHGASSSMRSPAARPRSRGEDRQRHDDDVAGRRRVRGGRDARRPRRPRPRRRDGVRSARHRPRNERARRTDRSRAEALALDLAGGC